jgi:hypothetical protein
VLTIARRIARLLERRGLLTAAGASWSLGTIGLTRGRIRMLTVAPRSSLQASTAELLTPTMRVGAASFDATWIL